MIKRKCKQCGKDFTVTDSEEKFYKEKNLELPKRCSDCRKKNKSNTIKENQEIHNSNNENIKYTGNNKGKTFRNIIIVAMLVVLGLLGKVFNIDFNELNIGNALQNNQSNYTYEFRNDNLLDDHFLKHGDEFGYTSKEEYLEGAKEVITSETSMHKKEDEDGDDIYYDKDKNEIVFVSSDGYIRTYFKPSGGIEYFNRH